VLAEEVRKVEDGEAEPSAARKREAVERHYTAPADQLGQA